MSDPIYALANIFKHLPGIGERQAYRIVYDLLNKDKSFTNGLIAELEKIHRETNICPECFRRYIKNQEPICSICNDPKTDNQTIMVVERDTDLNAILSTKLYNGLYFVLGGSVPVLEKNPEKRIRLKDLVNRVEKIQNLKEIILATSITPAGENTEEIIKAELKNFASQNNILIKSLGRGISTGTEIEYIDPETFFGALKNRS